MNTERAKLGAILGLVLGAVAIALGVDSSGVLGILGSILGIATVALSVATWKRLRALDRRA